MDIKTKPTKGKSSKVITPKYKKIIKEWNEATPYEVWEGFRDNFVFAFIGATLVVFIATKTDIAVLLGYLFLKRFGDINGLSAVSVANQLR